MRRRNRYALDIHFLRSSHSLEESFGLCPHSQESSWAARHQVSGTTFEPEQCRSYRARAVDRFLKTKACDMEKPHFFSYSFPVVDTQAAGIGAYGYPDANVFCLPDLFELVVQILPRHLAFMTPLRERPGVSFH